MDDAEELCRALCTCPRALGAAIGAALRAARGRPWVHDRQLFFAHTSSVYENPEVPSPIRTVGAGGVILYDGLPRRQHDTFSGPALYVAALYVPRGRAVIFVRIPGRRGVSAVSCRTPVRGEVPRTLPQDFEPAAPPFELDLTPRTFFLTMRRLEEQRTRRSHPLGRWYTLLVWRPQTDAE